MRIGGFSVAELIIVITVIGIISTITIVSYSGIQSQGYDNSVLSDIDRMEAAQTYYAKENDTVGKAYYSGTVSYDSDLDFSPSDGNVVDVVINSTDFCIRIYNTGGSYKSIATAAEEESSSGACGSISASAQAIADSP